MRYISSFIAPVYAHVSYRYVYIFLMYAYKPGRMPVHGTVETAMIGVTTIEAKSYLRAAVLIPYDR